MQRIWSLSLSLFLLSACATGAGSKISADFEIHGHRGARARLPENTIPSFEHALKAGANVLEADLGVTRDGHVIMNHDLEVDTELCVSSSPHLKGRVRPLVYSLTLKQIKTYDCGSAFDPDFPQRQLVPGTKIPTLAEFLTWLNRGDLEAKKTVRLNLETKIEAKLPKHTVSPEAFVDSIVRVLEHHKIQPERVILQSFDFRTIQYSKSKYPRMQVSALVEGDELNVSEVWQTTRAEYLSPDAGLLSRKKIREAHALGMRVVPWTINNPSHWGHFIRMGVDGIITDDPAGLVEYMKSKP
jgi:glycerophosphoryl diester phosphodiesterase